MNFVKENFDRSDQTLHYKLEPASKDYKFNSVCTLKVYYEEFSPYTNAGISALAE